MDLSVEDVAELLHVSEEKIYTWALEGKIPSYQIQQTHRFNKMQIEDWLLHHQEMLREEMNETVQGGQKSGMQQFCLYRALHLGDVYHGFKGNDKNKVIAEAVRFIAPQLELDPDVITELLLDREELMSTGLGRGIAVPHTRECFPRESFRGVKSDLVTIVVLEKPIAYGSLDGEPVDLLFFFFATEDKAHLHLLSKIAHLCSNESIVQKIRAGITKTELLKCILQWESTLALRS